MIEGIDHIGVVVDNVERVIGTLSALFGFTAGEPLKSPAGDFVAVMASRGDARIELIEPAGPTGSIARFLEQKGGGIHHVSLRVDDMARELASIREKGARLVGEGAVKIDSSLVAFIHPSSTEGVLIELIQK